jgi:hypothetical protein
LNTKICVAPTQIPVTVFEHKVCVAWNTNVMRVCACENLRAEFVAARSELQLVSKKTYNAYCENVEKFIKSDPKAFFKFVDLKKNRVGLPSVMKFKDEVATTTEAKCELFAKFIQSSYANDEWEPSDPGPEVLSDEIPLGSLQLLVTEVECALMDLDAQ